jgi:long-chain acyl-CoA synthetase
MILHAARVCTNVAALELEYIERFGTYTRLFHEDASYTNLEELVYASKLARLLRDYGVRPGDRIVTVMPNSPALTASFQAIWTLGAVAIPIMPQWTAAEVSHVLTNSGAKVVLTAPPLTAKLTRASEHVETVKHLLVFGDTDLPGTESIAPLDGGNSTIETPADRSRSDLAMLLYTSGTTAKPKGVMITHGNVLSSFANAFQLNPDLPKGPMLHMLPLTHVFGILMLKLANGWGLSSVLLSQFDPTRALQSIERHKPHYMPVVPTMLVYLLHHPERDKYNVSSLRRITNGGAALSEPLRLDFERAFGCRVEQGYGLSESVAVAAGYAEDTPYRPGSAGVATPGVQIRILDENNETLPPRGLGEICLSGGNITQGYWQDAEATRAAFSDGWLHTGDVGYLDEDGFLFITDRKKDLIIKGGENISPREIEEILANHPAVAESAVIGIPDPVFGEEICAVVQLKPGAQAGQEEMRAHVARFLTKFKIPVRVVFESALPRTSTGKVSKRDLRRQLNVSASIKQTAGQSIDSEA